MSDRSAIPGDATLLAVDLGGTKVAAARLAARGEILQRLEEPTNQQGPRPLIAQMARMLRSLTPAGERPYGIGVGIPAVLEPETDRVIWAPNLQGWRDVDLSGGLRDELEQHELPVVVEYDGHTAVLGEWWRGAARGYRSVAMIIVGTGIGGGLILDGRLYRGHNRLAGAAGWFALTSDAGAADPRGQSIGHWESLAAGPGIARRALAGLGEHPESSLMALPADRLSARQVFEAARAGDEFAGQVVADTARLIGLGVANVVSLANPEIVVLGGSVGRQPELLPLVKEVALRWAQPASAASVVIRSSQAGTDAGLYGAAYSVLMRAQESPPVPARTAGAGAGSEERS